MLTNVIISHFYAVMCDNGLLSDCWCAIVTDRTRLLLNYSTRVDQYINLYCAVYMDLQWIELIMLKISRTWITNELYMLFNSSLVFNEKTRPLRYRIDWPVSIKAWAFVNWLSAEAHGNMMYGSEFADNVQHSRCKKNVEFGWHIYSDFGWLFNWLLHWSFLLLVALVWLLASCKQYFLLPFNWQ